MDPVTTIAVGSTLTELLSTVNKYVKGGIDAYNKYGKVSLTDYSKMTNIMSRLYIEDTILRDDICVPIVGVLNQLYVSYILSALNLDTLCASGKTVKETLSVVSSESYDLVHEILTKFGSNKYNFSNEDVVVDLEPATQRLPVGRVIELSLTGITNVSGATTRSGFSSGWTSENGHSEGTDTTKNPRVHQHSHGPETTTHKTVTDPDGTVTETETTTSGDKNTYTEPYDVEKTTKSDSSKTSNVDTHTHDEGKSTQQTTFSFKIYLFVQLIPYVLNSTVVGGYLSANFEPTLKTRWNQFRAGEISFWNDFIFARDLIKKQQKILKNDKSGVITDMLNNNSNKLGKWFMGLFGVKPVSHNIANSILICSKESFDKACHENNIRFDNFEQRQKFFMKSWSMIVCVVDQNFNTVDMYFNGIEHKGTYTFDMMNKVGAKGKDSFDLKEIMGAFAGGMSPKF